MSRQLLRYGLTTALRPFTLPAWNRECELLLSDDVFVGGHVQRSNATRLAVEQRGVERVLTVFPGTRGTVTMRRMVTGASAMQLTIHVPEDCDITIIDEYNGSSVAHATVLTIAPGSTVRYTVICDLEPQALALIHYEAYVKQATVTWNVCAFGAETTQLSVDTVADEGSVVNTNTVTIGNDQQQFDLHVSTRHIGPKSSGNMLSRAVLDDRARVITHGLIRIEETAGNSDSYQKSETILLSDAAGADAIPNLEIHNHNVRCSHGATIGKIDAEKLFYLTSRGISEADAKRAITEGFISSMLPPELAQRALAKFGAQ